MKKLTQAIFDGVGASYTAASIDQNGDVWVITGDKNDFYCTEDNQLSWNFPVKGGYIISSYDATDWQNSAIDRDTTKELTGSDLTRKMLADSTDMVNCYVSDDSDYDALNDKDERTIMGFSDGWFHTNSVASWKYAVPAPKEKELTGSDLCRAMLERGDKYIMCFTSCTSDDSAILKGRVETVISEAESTRWNFETVDDLVIYAVPINNQGQPLTAAEVGL